jgi:hypothetical protein
MSGHTSLPFPYNHTFLWHIFHYMHKISISLMLSLYLQGKAGLLNQDYWLATTCSFEGRSFPAKYCSTNDFGSTGRTALVEFAWTLAFLRVGYLYLRWTTSFKINSTYSKFWGLKMSPSKGVLLFFHRIPRLGE